MTATLHSIAVFVNNIERAKEFYVGQLGLTVWKEGSFGLELLDGPHIGVHPAEHPDAKKLVGRHTGITLHVTQLLDLCTRLGEQGVKFIAEPTQQGFGIMALVADPSGNILALWEDNVSPPPEEESNHAGTRGARGQ